MKTLKFREHLVPLVLSGEKYVTWRFFDDKDIRVDDTVALINWNTKEQFATAVVTEVLEKPYHDITDADRVGHEKFVDLVAESAKYKEYYGDRWTEDALVKVIHFKLV